MAVAIGVALNALFKAAKPDWYIGAESIHAVSGQLKKLKPFVKSFLMLVKFQLK